MLIRFGVSNHSSIREYQELSLVASPIKDDQAALLSSSAVKEPVLPAALIYGANASGKSNVLSALALMRSSIRLSHAGRSPTDNIPRDHFRLDRTSATTPTQFDCDFIVDGVRYHYGFTCSSSRYESEWLYAFPGKKRQMWFYREGGLPISFGKFLRGQNKLIAALTRPNSLFLSAAAQNAHVQLSPIFQFFDRSLLFSFSTSASSVEVTARLSQDGIDNRIVDFLKIADFGISDVIVEDQQPPESSRENDFGKALEQLIKTHIPDLGTNFEAARQRMKLIRFTHSGEDRSRTPMSLDDESQGTLRMISLLAPALKALDEGRVLIIDEIDASLHTLLANRFVSLFCRSSTNKRNAQLVATTHDTNLLCSGAVRRDQIWFTEKSKAGATHLYPLSDISTRKSDNLEKGYIQGRFGAVPFLGRLERIFQQEAFSAG